MPVTRGVYSQQQPTCFEKIKSGFPVGFCVGMISGAIFGGFAALRGGLRGRELVAYVARNMINGGGTFSTFMSIGIGLRC